MQTLTVPMVHVDLNNHGQWEVAGPSERIRCETLEAARSVGYLCAERSRPCELVIRDAYHRVLRRELIDDHIAR